MSCVNVNCQLHGHIFRFTVSFDIDPTTHKQSQLMRFITYATSGCAGSPEPSLFAHMKYGSRRRVRPKIKHLAALDDCACAFEEWVYGGRKVPKSHEMAQFIKAHRPHKNNSLFLWPVPLPINLIFSTPPLSINSIFIDPAAH